MFFRDLFLMAGISLDAYRGTALNRRIPACLRFLRVPDLETGRKKLKAHPELVSPLLNVVLLGVTDFCRDPAVFERLRQLVATSLDATAKPMRVWSAACSDGRELYSVAVLLQQAGRLAGSELLGTDCRRDALRLAQAAEYPQDALGALPFSWHDYFTPARHGVRVVEWLRRPARWKQGNLLEGAEPGPWDLILWRNMAIYLEASTAECLWQSIIRELRPGGFLVVGKADHPPQWLPIEKLGPCIFRKSS